MFVFWSLSLGMAGGHACGSSSIGLPSCASEAGPHVENLLSGESGGPVEESNI